MDWIYPLADWLYRQMKPARWRMKLVRSVFFSSLKWPLCFKKIPFLLVFSCPKINNSTIMMSINCLCFQDRHREIVNYPFKASHLRKRSTNADPTLKLVTVYLLHVFFCFRPGKIQRIFGCHGADKIIAKIFVDSTFQTKLN